MPFNVDIPADNTDPWGQPLRGSWSALKTFLNGLESKANAASSTVFVTSGNEPRPDIVGSVSFIDQRSGTPSAPVNLDPQRDLWFKPGTGGDPVFTAPTIVTTSLNSMVQGQAFSQLITATGSTPMTWAVSAGVLPAGLTLNTSTGVISGTPTSTGAYSFTLRATNSVGNDTQAFTGSVVANVTPPVITTTTLPALTQGVPMSVTLAKTGSTPMTWGVVGGALPSGLSINSSSGVISGTPLAPGVYSFTVQATNSAGSDTQVFSGTIAGTANPVAQHSVFGTEPGTTYQAFSDGNGSLLVANQFYTHGTPVYTDWELIGIRIYVPATAPAGVLTGGGFVAFSGPPSGSDSAFDFWGPGRDSVTLETRLRDNTTPFTTLQAGQWNDIMLAEPFPWVHGRGFMVGYQLAGGNAYFHSSLGGSTDRTDSVEAGVRLTRSEHGGVVSRGFNTAGLWNGPAYGIDIILRGAA